MRRCCLRSIDLKPLKRPPQHCRNFLRGFNSPVTDRYGIANNAQFSQYRRWIVSRSNHPTISQYRCYGTSICHGSTIYALSTAPGRAAIAIIRVSGPACLAVYRGLCPGKSDPKPRHATLRRLLDPSSGGEVIDSGALVFYFPAPETVTGEDILELHVHGGPAIVKAVLSRIAKTSAHEGSIRYAEPGEFTKRAFYNNRLDLTEVEALGDTLSAETEQQRRLAVRGSTSTLAERYEQWRQQLLAARGELEALIDFSEDQHFDESPSQLCASVASQVQDLQTQLRASIQSASRGELLRNGINIALVGPPNVGKSSLLNRIVGREAAIVSEEAGTTRDVVDVTVDIGGYLCRFGDLAGLRRQQHGPRESLNKIEKEGILRAHERASNADVLIAFLTVDNDLDAPEDGKSKVRVSLDTEVEATIQRLDPASQSLVCVLNKADLFTDWSDVKTVSETFSKHPALRKHLEASKIGVLPISCRLASPTPRASPSIAGVEPLLQSLVRVFGNMTEAVTPSAIGTSGNTSPWVESLGATERQRILLQQCLEYLDEFLSEVRPSGAEENADTRDDEIDVVVAAEHLRSAATCLAKITGRGEMSGDVEDVLGVVFEKFCVGK